MCFLSHLRNNFFYNVDFSTTCQMKRTGGSTLKVETETSNSKKKKEGKAVTLEQISWHLCSSFLMD